MKRERDPVEAERKRCYDLVQHALDELLATTRLKPGTTHANWTALLGALLHTIRSGGDATNLERACPAVFGPT